MGILSSSSSLKTVNTLTVIRLGIWRFNCYYCAWYHIIPHIPREKFLIFFYYFIKTNKIVQIAKHANFNFLGFLQRKWMNKQRGKNVNCSAKKCYRCDVNHKLLRNNVYLISDLFILFEFVLNEKLHGLPMISSWKPIFQ